MGSRSVLILVNNSDATGFDIAEMLRTYEYAKMRCTPIETEERLQRFSKK